MRLALDTSVIVAVSIATHPHHLRARVWLDAIAAGQHTGMVTTHALAELFATLTAIPIEPRVPVGDILRLCDRLASHLQVVELRRDDYGAAMLRCSELGLRSGRVYDALHLASADREGADMFLTFNVRDFAALARPHGPRVAAPPDPPGLTEF